MTQTSLLFQTQLLPVSGMSQQARRGEKRKLQLKRAGGRQKGRGHSVLLRMTKLSFYYLRALHLHSLQNTQVKATQPGATQPHGTLCIHTVVTPQLRLILSH